MAVLDHTIVPVSDAESSVRFYGEILGFAPEGKDGPFSVVRVGPDTILLFAPWGTDGGHHYAFTLPAEDFDAAFARLKAAGVPYGDSFHKVGNMQGPGDEFGAHGMGAALYFFDPDQHLIELRHD